MRLVLGPYDLVCPSPASALALVLAEDGGGVVTLSPTPLEGDSPDTVRDAARAVPRYMQLLDAWRWTGPLWNAGLLVDHTLDSNPLEDIRLMVAQIANDPTAAPLRNLSRNELFTDSAVYLQALTRDLLRGGGDPGVTIPVLVGLERFAARLGLPLVRCKSPSRTARFDRLSGTAPPILFRLTIPVLLGPAAATVLRNRELLAEPLASLRAAMNLMLPGEFESDATQAARRLRIAAEDYAQQFRETLPVLREIADRAGDAMRPAEVSFTASLIPIDASLRAAVRAIASLSGRRSPVPAPSTTALALPRVLVFTTRPAPWDLTVPMAQHASLR